jgi:hypothetical protein
VIAGAEGEPNGPAQSLRRRVTALRGLHRRDGGIRAGNAGARSPGDNILASPVVGMTHGVVMKAFTALIVAYVIESLVRQRTIHNSEFRIQKLH